MHHAIRDYLIGAYRWLSSTTAFDSTAVLAPLPAASVTRQRSKLHHFRPVLHLRHFAAADGLVTVYHKNKPAPFRTKAENIGAEYYLYAPEEGEDPADDAIEKWLADHIDGPASLALQKIQAGSQLSSSEKSALAAYVGLQDMRTPLARDLILKMFQTELKTDMESYAGDVRRLRREIWRDQGAWVRLEEISRYAQIVEVVVPKTAWLNYIGDAVNKAGRRIFDMKWYLIQTPGSYEFITNDLGIVKGRNGFDDLRSYQMGVTAYPFWVVPLTPLTALALAPPFAASSFRPTNAWVGEVNKRLIRDSHRQVYSRSEAPFVLKVWGRG